MQTRQQIRLRLKQVVYRHLQRRLRDNFRKTPLTCRHNKTVSLGHDVVHLCGYITDGLPRNVLCDPRAAGCDSLAKACPFWEPLSSKEEVKASFDLLLASDFGTIAAQYPDIAALMWALSDPDEESEDGGEIDLGLSEPAPAHEPALPDPVSVSLPEEHLTYRPPSLWDRFLIWLGRL